jgi:hypothetical protein
MGAGVTREKVMSKPSRYTPRRARIPAAVCAVILLACGSASAGEQLQFTVASFMDIDAQVDGAKGRPNEEQRLRGLKSWKNGRYDGAVKAFETAAYHADKYSQHYLSLIYWYGAGVPVDRVQAYIWSDLAAERGSKRLLAIREKMWMELTPAQQADVQEQGEVYYAKYGDEVAQPRAEGEMRRFARNMTGSRVGYRNQRLETIAPPRCGSFDCPPNYTDIPASPDQLYGPEGGLARMATYWQQQDRLIEEGTVEVGAPETLRKPAKGSNGGRSQGG